MPGAPWDKNVRAGDYRAVLNQLEGGPEVPDSFECNGLTFVPDDYPFLEDCTAVGIIHDWRWQVGGSWAEFRAGNSEIYRNLLARHFPKKLAWVRWLAVSTIGIAFFTWHLPPGPWHWLSHDGLGPSRIERGVRADLAGLNRKGILLEVLKIALTVPAVRNRLVALLAALATALGITLSAAPADAISVGLVERVQAPFGGAGPNQPPVPFPQPIPFAERSRRSFEAIGVRRGAVFPDCQTVGELFYDNVNMHLYACTDAALEIWGFLLETVIYDVDEDGYVDLAEGLQAGDYGHWTCLTDSGPGTGTCFIDNQVLEPEDMETDGVAFTDEFCLTAESTGTDFEWHPCVTVADKGDITTSSNGTVWEIDADAVGSPEIAANAVDSSEIAASAVGASEIADGSIAEVDLNEGNGPTDEFCLTFESGGGADLRWQSCSGGAAADVPQVFHAFREGGYGTITGEGDCTLAIPNGGDNSQNASSATSCEAASEAASSRQALYRVPAGYKMVLKLLSATIADAADRTAGNGCTVGVVHGTDSAGGTPTYTATLGSINVGGDYALNQTGEQATASLSDTSVLSSVGGWVAFSYEDADDAGADTCTLQDDIQLSLVFTLSTE